MVVLEFVADAVAEDAADADADAVVDVDDQLSAAVAGHALNVDADA